MEGKYKLIDEGSIWKHWIEEEEEEFEIEIIIIRQTNTWVEYWITLRRWE